MVWPETSWIWPVTELLFPLWTYKCDHKESVLMSVHIEYDHMQKSCVKHFEFTWRCPTPDCGVGNSSYCTSHWLTNVCAKTACCYFIGPVCLSVSLGHEWLMIYYLAPFSPLKQTQHSVSVVLAMRTRLVHCWYKQEYDDWLAHFFKVVHSTKQRHLLVSGPHQH